MRLVPIHCIKEGNSLAKSVFDANGRVLLKEGVVLSSKILERVENNGFQSLYIIDEYSQGEIEDVIKPQLRQKAVQALKSSFDSFKSYYFQTNPASLPLKNRIELKAKNKYMSNMNQIAKELVDELLANKNLLVNLVDIKNLDSYTYQHSVNVAVLSLIMGIEQGLERQQLHELAIGALVHDIGKVFIEPTLLSKKEPLRDAEFDCIKEHAFKGYEYLKDLRDMKGSSKRIIWEHHERLDASGYPRSLTINTLHLFSRIVAIADVYDALTSDRPYRKSLPANEAIEYFMGSTGRYFDTEIATTFIKKIVVYPVGTLIRLSNGNIGTVVSNHPQLSLRPKVKLINMSQTETIMDLSQENDVVIEAIQYEIPTSLMQKRE